MRQLKKSVILGTKHNHENVAEHVMHINMNGSYRFLLPNAS